MCQSNRDVSLGFCAENYPAGTHMCLIYNDEQERRKLIAKFLGSGVVTGEKVSYFADNMSAAEVVGWLREMEIETSSLQDSNQFEVLSAADVYYPSGSFDTEAMLENLRIFYNQSREDKYPGVRVSGEMAWALNEIPGAEHLMEYEALVNVVLATHPVTAICQYDANRFDGATIFNVLKVHPMMIVHGQVVKNPYYMKPEQFIKDFTGNNHE